MTYNVLKDVKSYSLTHSPTHSLTHPLTRSPTLILRQETMMWNCSHRCCFDSDRL